MNTAIDLLCLAAILLVTLVIQRWYKRQVERRSLPPGPKGWPIVGNITNIPTEKGWLGYASMAKEYGDVVYLEALGQPMIVLNSIRSANELLEKRSGNNSDRPVSFMLNELVGWGFNAGFTPYGEVWRRRRKLLHGYFHRKAVDIHQPVQQEETRVLLRDLLRDPDNFFFHVRKHAAAIILKITYGHDIQSDDDPLIHLAEASLQYMNQTTSGGVYMVDIFPILRHLPSWFPGAGFKKLAADAKYVTTRMLTEPVEEVKTKLANKSAAPCFTVHLLQDLEGRVDVHADHEKAIRDAIGITYAGGADTWSLIKTVSSILTFILAMVYFPEVQKKAQAELDAVVGAGKLPYFEHQPDLSYIQGVVAETLRWQSVAPLAVPHKSLVEDVYNGYRIPAGTVIIPNIWAMTRDETTYPDPEKFDPERYLKKQGKDLPTDPANLAFGFGRRVCPGKHFALNNVWITIASILSMYTIKKELDENGREVDPVINYSSGVVSQPDSFRCRFIPRFDNIQSILQPVA